MYMYFSCITVCLHLSLQVEHGRPNSAKAVFYQAIQQCPGAKV